MAKKNLPTVQRMMLRAKKRKPLMTSKPRRLQIKPLQKVKRKKPKRKLLLMKKLRRMMRLTKRRRRLLR